MKSDSDIRHQRDFIRRVIDRCGPRLPGSPEERRAAGIISEEFRAIAGNVTVEEFTFAAKACIGPIPGYGLGLIVAGLFFFRQPLATLILASALFAFAVIQIVLYKGWFDIFFPKSTSQNVHSVIDPPGGMKNVKATLVLSAHIGSSWHCTHFAEKSHLARYKLGFAALSPLLLITLSIIRYLDADFRGVLPWSLWWTMLIVPFLYMGFYFLFRYLVYARGVASPGAMDNMA